MPICLGRGASRFWRLYFPNGSVQAYTAITEVTMSATSGGADQCNGGIPSASANDGTHTPAKAFDNSVDKLNYWSSVSDGACWLQYEFLTAVDVKEFSITVYSSYAGYGPSDIYLQYSDNGTDFVTVQTFTATWAIGNITNTFTVTM